jgi:hypothetical protein
MGALVLLKMIEARGTENLVMIAIDTLWRTKPIIRTGWGGKS